MLRRPSKGSTLRTARSVLVGSALFFAGGMVGAGCSQDPHDGQSNPGTIMQDQADRSGRPSASGSPDSQTGGDLGFLLGESSAILRVDAFHGESGPPLRLFPDQPEVKLNIAADIGEVTWMDDRRIDLLKQRSKVTEGRVSLELLALSTSAARSEFEILQSVTLPIYVTVMVIPAVRNNPDGGLQIMSAFTVGKGSTVNVIFPRYEALNKDFRALGLAMNQAPGRDLLIDWMKELSVSQATGHPGKIQLAYKGIVR